ncbi:hypothetical protein AYI69_g1502 [Smittium culicis]|uniref:Uncharacterized protein n=1 Tax=Smittium culicis TaxID=133412 RepID=A0A1R1YQ32_9FUNG|nr:hypothetical protein AYI69_g1502 [Smittium culicis]
MVKELLREKERSLDPEDLYAQTAESVPQIAASNNRPTQSNFRWRSRGSGRGSQLDTSAGPPVTGDQNNCVSRRLAYIWRLKELIFVEYGRRVSQAPRAWIKNQVGEISYDFVSVHNPT